MAGGVLLSPVVARRSAGSAERFNALLAERWAAPFEWGVHDYCLWAADTVRALTGSDPAAALRGRYSGAANAGRLVRSLGGLHAIATRALGAPLATPLLAGIGDIGLTGAGALAVCIGEWWTAPGRHGLMLLPLADATAAWRVG